MNLTRLAVLCALGGWLMMEATHVTAQQHRATRLGNPATRFAAPLVVKEDLRWRFRDRKLQSDIVSVLQQAGWKGDPRDLFHAATNAPLEQIDLPVGYRMPFMSSREGGRPICLMDVVWEGTEPTPAVVFEFTSQGRMYRCVTPMACSNFFIEDRGPEPQPELVLSCNVPARVPWMKPVRVCFTIENRGPGTARSARLVLPISGGGNCVETTGPASLGPEGVVWEFFELKPGSTNEACAVLEYDRLGDKSLSGTIRYGTVETQSACQTTIFGVAAILIDAIDLEDPVQVGTNVTYVIKVTNQATYTGTNVRITGTLPPSLEFVSGSGASLVSGEGQVFKIAALPSLAGKGVAEWQIVARALKEDDARLLLELSSDQFEKPILEIEPTRLY